jgi:hypothetical protein
MDCWVTPAQPLRVKASNDNRCRWSLTYGELLPRIANRYSRSEASVQKSQSEEPLCDSYLDIEPDQLF